MYIQFCYAFIHFIEWWEFLRRASFDWSIWLWHHFINRFFIWFFDSEFAKQRNFWTKYNFQYNIRFFFFVNWLRQFKVMFKIVQKLRFLYQTIHFQMNRLQIIHCYRFSRLVQAGSFLNSWLRLFLNTSIRYARNRKSFLAQWYFF